MNRYFSLMLSPLLLAFVGGCSEYVEGYRYAPRPAVAEVPATQASQPPVVSALVSVIGIHHADKDQGIPESVEVRLRLENNGPGRVVFDPSTMELLDGGLMKFPPPVLFPRTPVTLDPLQATTVGAFFPFPVGHTYENTDVEAFQLHWDIQIDGRRGEQGVSFRRILRYYGPYYDYPPEPYPYRYYGGIVVIRRRW